MSSLKIDSEEHKHLLDQVKQIAEGLGRTFAPFCEVVVHDLTHPRHAILAIHNNLSSREIGAPATELGLARIADPAYPQIIANYANSLPSGQPVKSTSIGIKDKQGDYIAALCLNLDLAMFQSLQAVLNRFTSIDLDVGVHETLQSGGADGIREKINEFAARLGRTPRSLAPSDRKAMIQDLKEAGFLEIRRAPEIIATHIGVSRATVYADAKP